MARQDVQVNLSKALLDGIWGVRTFQRPGKKERGMAQPMDAVGPINSEQTVGVLCQLDARAIKRTAGMLEILIGTVGGVGIPFLPQAPHTPS